MEYIRENSDSWKNHEAGTKKTSQNSIKIRNRLEKQKDKPRNGTRYSMIINAYTTKNLKK